MSDILRNVQHFQETNPECFVWVFTTIVLAVVNCYMILNVLFADISGFVLALSGPKLVKFEITGTFS